MPPTHPQLLTSSWRSALTCAAAGLVLAASGGAAAAAVAPAGPGHAQVSRAAGLPAVLSAQVSHKAADAHAARAKPAAHAAHAARAKPAVSMSELIPHGTSGPQTWMPIGAAQRQNATTIVHQALALRMGPRAAVIAVATAMQESGLVNVDYGTSDSLGLFQQQPDCGWGTAQQVMNPAYAADAFLRALQRHEQADPAWNSQPLWMTAQAVQGSAFPYAYAKWESQAAHLVHQIVG